MSPTITSPRNQHVLDATKLRDRRGREKQNRIIIDGAREILRALEAGVELVDLFVCVPLPDDEQLRALIERAEAQKVQVLPVSPDVFRKMAYGERTEGLLATAVCPTRSLTDIESSVSPLVVVIEGVEKPGNIGAVIRSADAAGASSVIVAEPATDLHNPNTIRSSLGAIFTVPVAAAPNVQVLDWLRRQQLDIYAARVDGAASYADVDLTGRVAIVVGSEAQGLSPVWYADDITTIKLPMMGTVDSLNVSATASVLLYEALRQRTA